MITNRIPVFKDGKLIGALGTVLFKDVKDVNELAHHLIDLQSKINKYRGELERIEGAKYSFDSIVTRDSRMKYLKRVSKMAAQTNFTVLITGESGTGKELFANGIHKASYRKDEPFIAINCAAIPKDLLESELFGYNSGAFTGAKKDGKLGKFEQASAGTIFLDEIGGMPMDMQVKILRVLESREFERIGSNKKIIFDSRVIAATNANLEEEIKKGRFREDLYYRLDVIRIEIPPLRNRKDDIEILAEHMLKDLSKEMHVDVKELPKRTLGVLKSHDWPGNIRELRNVLERAINITRGKLILAEDLPDRINAKSVSKISHVEDIPLLRDVTSEAEKEAISKALNITNGNKSLAANKLGLHRTTLYKKLINIIFKKELYIRMYSSFFYVDIYIQNRINIRNYCALLSTNSDQEVS